MSEKWIINGYTVINGKDYFSDCKPLDDSLRFDNFADAVCAFRQKITHFAMIEDTGDEDIYAFDNNGIFIPVLIWGPKEVGGQNVPDNLFSVSPAFIQGVQDVFRMIKQADYSPSQIDSASTETMVSDMIEIILSAEDHSLKIVTGCDSEINGYHFALCTNMLDMSSPDEEYYFISYAFLADESADGINLWLKKAETEE